MKYVLYTTTSSSWYRQEAKKASVFLSQTEGREDIQIDVVKVKPPKEPQLVRDPQRDIRFSWDWFTAQFPVGEYDGVGFHFTPYYRKKWGIKRADGKGYGGSKHTGNKEYPEFWICCGKEGAEGYPFSDFVRLIVHEVSHFDEDVDDGNGNGLIQESVHAMDYNMKKIHLYPLLVDYRGLIIKRKVNAIINKAIDLVRNAFKI